MNNEIKGNINWPPTVKTELFWPHQFLMKRSRTKYSMVTQILLKNKVGKSMIDWHPSSFDF